LTGFLTLCKNNAEVAREWLRSNVWAVEHVTEEDENEARQVIFRYTDKTFSYTDATSVAVMNRRSIRTAFAFDPHFRQHGFQLIP
jgi:predicted nucleic acid-binding protein